MTDSSQQAATPSSLMDPPTESAPKPQEADSVVNPQFMEGKPQLREVVAPARASWLQVTGEDAGAVMVSHM